jgi:hypothetical protein
MSKAATTTLGTLSESALRIDSMTAACSSSSINKRQASVALVTVPGRAFKHLAAILEQTELTILYIMRK